MQLEDVSRHHDLHAAAELAQDGAYLVGGRKLFALDHRLGAKLEVPLGGDIKADLSVYGANLLNDTKHVVSGIDFGQLGFSEVQFQMPRSFGASLTITY